MKIHIDLRPKLLRFFSVTVYRYDESLMPTKSELKCSSAKIIDIHESAELQIKQKQQQEVSIGIQHMLLIKVLFLYCWPDCPICLVQLNSIG